MDRKEKGYAIMDWIQVAQYRVQWLAVVSTKMKLLVLKRAGHFLTSWVA